MLYLWFKAFHLIALICWFAGLFYLPRLFVYHAQSSDTVSHERFCLMERKLYRGIMLPAMILTLVFGIGLLVINPSWMTQGWMHTKLALVVVLIGYHHVCGATRKKFERGENKRSHVFYRWFNEVPVLILIAVVILVVVKPY
ncbi:protoporphyrinogen oxidase HemJ [Pseudomonas sp. EpS/L25]|uniref:protoporphyrinogen oxidase HemJ n=1 Tax=Pseudomonas sp. EpS/L25 TaxID=1749078 RepID=UPI000743702E|nr:protoporphyrinogen oxidase HemJ [Pseudomonas sp. EpS/L25]KUM38722.1 hypothetical protein AR540_13520 [Pseudomonas sp. EpS/L25]